MAWTLCVALVSERAQIPPPSEWKRSTLFKMDVGLITPTEKVLLGPGCLASPNLCERKSYQKRKCVSVSRHNKQIVLLVEKGHPKPQLFEASASLEASKLPLAEIQRNHEMIANNPELRA